MKTIIASVLFLSLLIPAYANVVIGKVNVQKILVTVKEGQGVRDKLKTEFEKKQKQVQTEEEKIKTAQENFKKQSLVMNASTKEKKEQELQKMYMDLQKMTMDFQKEMQNMEEKFKGPILEKVKGIVEEISKKEGVDVTFEVSTTPIIFAKEEKDLTDKVIEAYDKKFK